MKIIRNISLWVFGVVFVAIPTGLILMTFVAVAALIFKINFYSFNYEVPENFVIAKELYSDWHFAPDGCEAAVYQIKKFNLQNQDLLKHGFSEFRPDDGKYIYINEKDEDITSKVKLTIREGGYCVQGSSEWEIFRYLGGDKNEALISHHKDFRRFLVFDPKTNLLFYFMA